MPPLRPLPAEITSLTDEELMEQLLRYDYRPGPILPSTRSVYERKLFKLQTGEQALPSTTYEPVDDEDDDDQEEESEEEEVVLQQQQPRLRTTRSTKTEVKKTPPREPFSPRQSAKAGGADRTQSAHSKREASPPAKGGLPLWVKFLAILIVASLVFLVIKNMESNPDSEGPEIPEQLEINV